MRACILFFILSIFTIPLNLWAQQDSIPTYSAQYQMKYVRTWNALSPELNAATLINKSTKDVQETTTYHDGRGRPVQTVIKKGSFATGGVAKDFVKAALYDADGLQRRQYLPFVANAAGGNTSLNDGNFKITPFDQQAEFYMGSESPIMGQGETFFYSENIFESSPLARLQKTMAPGNSWTGSGRGKSVKNAFNTIHDSIIRWNVPNNLPESGIFSFYNKNANGYSGLELSKTIITDEHGKEVITFSNREGLVVLQKVQMDGDIDTGEGTGYHGWLCTYYIYDDLNRIRCVIQPKGVELLSKSNWHLTPDILNEQSYRYEYDGRDRVIMKKIPGMGEVFMVYDSRDRLVMTQDARQRLKTEWTIVKYDELNRPVESGLWINSSTFDFHRKNAATQTQYPAPESNYELLSFMHYDNYDNLPSGLTPGLLTNWNTHFSPTNTTTWPYPEMPVKSESIKNKITWTKTRILNSNPAKFLNSVLLYDEKGRVIQMQSINHTGGLDVTTIQYSWAGLPLVTVQKQEKGESNGQTVVLVTRNSYDDLNRLVETEKKQSHTQVDGGAMSTFKTINQLEYNALGQVKTKKIGHAPLETITYDYNIRGWLLGANREYVKGSSTDNYFGYDLGYDKNGIIGSYNPQYNRNISGTVWKSKGDGEKRKYDYTYDPVNRLTGADFNQHQSGSGAGAVFSKNKGIDFTVSGLSYDANGNMLSMKQKGLKINASSAIDELTYHYQANTNRLTQVTDSVNDTESRLGDFKYDETTKQSIDYLYDVNGNMIRDNNKDISAIIYNHLNLPETIEVNGKGTMTYLYDASGNKLKRTVIDQTVSPSKTTVTTYLGASVYVNDTLQFMAHEEGRIRPLKDTSGNIKELTYDYFLRDHLNNVRMVLTEEQKTDLYPAASMETAQAAIEEALYANVNTTRVDLPPGYPTDNYTDPNEKVALVSGSGNKNGPSMLLKVMAGDQFNIMVSSWYKSNGTPPGTPVNLLPGLLDALSNSVSQVAAPSHAGAFATELQSSSVFINGITDFQNSKSYSSNKPKAYLNWILLDEQFKFVSAGSGAEQVPDEATFGIAPNNQVHSHVKSNMPIAKNGYLYVFVSNESPDINVYFDNLQVTHKRGPILEESHYYPFGLTMAGISSKAINEAIENKYKFNGGTELNSTFDINLYETFFRSYDPQIGRFHQIDPLTESTSNWSAYSFVQNNPLLYLDPLGLDTIINGQNHQWDGGFLDDVIISGRNEGWVIDASGGWDNNSDPFYQSWVQEQYNWQRGIKGGGYEATVELSVREDRGQQQQEKYNWSPVGNTLLAVGITFDGLEKSISNKKYWVDAKGNIKSTGLLKPGLNGKYVIGVQGLRNGQAAAARAAAPYSIAGNVVGGLGMGVTLIQYGTGQISGFEASVDFIMGGIGLTGWGAPVSLIYFGGKFLYEYSTGNTLFEKP